MKIERSQSKTQYIIVKDNGQMIVNRFFDSIEKAQYFIDNLSQHDLNYVKKVDK
jgi:hypothetical protein